MKKLNPTVADVTVWLKQLDRTKLHEQGWIEINKRFHSITRAARPFLTEQFPDEKERQAAFDGLTLALLTIGHFVDVEILAELLAQPAISSQSSSPQPIQHLSHPKKTPETT